MMINNTEPTSPLRNESSLLNSRTGLLKAILGFQVSEVIHVAVQLNLADLIKDGEMSDEELAVATGTNQAALYRFLRVLVSIDVLNEVGDHPRRFTLTDAGKLLQKGVPGSVYSMARFFAGSRSRKIWQNLLFSVQTGEANIKDTWEYYGQHPEEATDFYNFMSESSQQIATSFAATYAFGGIGVVADIGGAQGQILAIVMKAHPHIKGILFDLPQIVAGAQANLAREGIAEQCQVIAGNIFNAWPIKADLYILSRIIHDWEDEKALSILKNCRAAMEPGSKVVVLERILPANKDAALLYYLSDLQMLVGLGGKERNEEEYRKLFEGAGLTFSRIIPLTPPYSLIEAIVA